MKNSKVFQIGFTLTELMIVVIILGILATMAYPRFTRTIEIQKGREAVVGLELIVGAEKLYSLQTGTYIACANTTDCNTKLNLDLRSENWFYSVDGVVVGPPPTFTAKATRTSGPNSGTFIGMDENGDFCPAAMGCDWPYANLL